MRTQLKSAVLFIISIMVCIMSVSCGSSTGRGEYAGGEDTEILSIDTIKDIVLERVPGASEENIIEMEGEYEDGKYEYEGSIYYDGYVYEFEIDGESGNILSWEIDD